MLDSDVAFLFGVTVSSLNRQMRRNVIRFPSDFCFQLSDKETNDLRCQKEDIIHMHIRKKALSHLIFTLKIGSIRYIERQNRINVSIQNRHFLFINKQDNLYK